MPKDPSFFQDVWKQISNDARQGHIKQYILINTDNIYKPIKSLSGLGYLENFISKSMKGDDPSILKISSVGKAFAKINFQISAAVGGVNKDAPGELLQKMKRASPWRIPVKAVLAAPSAALYGCCYALNKIDNFARDNIKNPILKNSVRGVVNAVALPFTATVVAYTGVTIGLVLGAESVLRTAFGTKQTKEKSPDNLKKARLLMPYQIQYKLKCTKSKNP
jgi:hypothetical protein